MGNWSSKDESKETKYSQQPSKRENPSCTQTYSGASAPSYSTTQTKAPKAAHQTVKLHVNNYIIPKPQLNERQHTQNIDLPFQSLPDKFGLRVCPQYNSKEGCNAPICRRLHVCLYWCLKKCNRTVCENDHSFTSSHNKVILDVFSHRSDFNDSLVFQYLKNTHKHFKKSKRGQHDCICMFNIMKRCKRNPCTKVHSTRPYLWEINYNENLLQLSYEQSDHLERLFCHPAQDKAEFPPLPSNVRHHSRYKQLRNVLSSSESWQVDMETMKISSGSSSIAIRRLSTPSDITYDLRVASRWIWYWCDDNGSWKPYTHGDNNKYFVVALSDHLEYHMHFSNEIHFFVKVGGQHYDINTREMTQKNIITGKIRKIRRRPACTVLEDKETSFDRKFTKLPKDKKYMLTPVLPQTSEYIFIEKMMSESLSNLSVSSINRMQNDHLWKTYQNKKRQLLCFYSNDLSKVNEQYLFHGTKHSVIDLICSENLDWRLFGSNVGNAYGQGTYFANNAKLSDSYSKTDDSGLRAMFIVCVLVGTMTVGNRSMEFPPINTTTGRCFDSTCNDRHDSTVIIKYNEDEYYPVYVVKYRTA